jgi:hypothetical protein
MTHQHLAYAGDLVKHNYIPGVVDIFEVSDPQEIKTLANDPKVDRYFNTRTCPVNWFFLKRSRTVLSFQGRRFPTMQPRDSADRAHAQEELWRRLNEESAGLKAGPVALEPLAQWIRGTGSDDEVGLLAQQFLGNLLRSDFAATRESWNAALILVAAPRLSNLAKLFWWFVSGKVRRAKQLLSGMVDGDLSAVNAIRVAVHNLVKSLRLMRGMFADANAKSSLSPEAAANQCLRAPLSLFRQSTAPGTLNGNAFPKNALFQFNIGSASLLNGGRSLVFMEESWSACPASTWVPAMLEGLWTRATTVRQ